MLDTHTSSDSSLTRPRAIDQVFYAPLGFTRTTENSIQAQRHPHSDFCLRHGHPAKSFEYRSLLIPLVHFPFWTLPRFRDISLVETRDRNSSQGEFLIVITCPSCPTGIAATASHRSRAD